MHKMRCTFMRFCTFIIHKTRCTPVRQSRAPLIFAIGNVGDRTQSCGQRRPCEIVGWLIVDAASSTSVALLQLLVVDVVVVCNLL